jgi:hypothetical protein
LKAWLREKTGPEIERPIRDHIVADITCRGTHRGHDNTDCADTDLRTARDVLVNHLSSRWIDRRGNTIFQVKDDDWLLLRVRASAREDLGISACSRLAHSEETTEPGR